MKVEAGKVLAEVVVSAPFPPPAPPPPPPPNINKFVFFGIIAAPGGRGFSVGAFAGVKVKLVSGAEVCVVGVVPKVKLGAGAGAAEAAAVLVVAGLNWKREFAGTGALDEVVDVAVLRDAG